jgi:hypothetical protein
MADSIVQALGPDHPDAIRALADRVHDVRFNSGDFSVAEELSHDVLERARRVFGEDDRTTRLLLHEQNHRDQARGLWGKAIGERRQFLNTIRQTRLWG